MLRKAGLCLLAFAITILGHNIINILASDDDCFFDCYSQEKKDISLLLDPLGKQSAVK